MPEWKRHTGFNPRTRVGCDGHVDDAAVGGAHVSIHAPAWGATQKKRPLVAGGPVSIHAPAWGATEDKAAGGLLHFRVSIHAPAWGATPLPHVLDRQRGGFNPRTRVGCDFHTPEYAASLRLFQSTHPRGVRRGVHRHVPFHLLFQSTHPRGVRPYPVENRQFPMLVSIHAPAWGATVSMFYPVDSRD